MASATNTLASYLQTPQGLYQITGFTSSSAVTITTPSGYANETGVAFSTWLRLFGATSATITAVTPAVARFEFQSVQPEFTILATSRIGAISFVTSNNTTTLTLYYNGTTHNSLIVTSEAVHHNALAGTQGGTSSEMYHLTAAQVTALSAVSSTQIASITSTQIGSLTTTQLQGFTATQIAALPSTAIAGTTSTQVAALSTTALGGLTSTQINGISALTKRIMLIQELL